MCLTCVEFRPYCLRPESPLPAMDENWRASPASSVGRSESASRELARTCYDEVKAELCVSALTVPPPYRDVPEVQLELLASITDVLSMDVDSEVEQAFTIVEYDEEGEVSARFPMLKPVEVTIPDELRVEPHAKYEAVAPSSISVQAEHNDDTCPFNIYADDPEFNHEAFANSFDLRAWELYTKPMGKLSACSCGNNISPALDRVPDCGRDCSTTAWQTRNGLQRDRPNWHDEAIRHPQRPKIRPCITAARAVSV